MQGETKYNELHSRYYDLVYKKYPGSKQTEKELKLIERVVTGYSSMSHNVRLLDIASGTGRHLIPLLKKGYHVDGVEESRWMLRMLRIKANKADVKIKKLYCGDIKKIKVLRKYDGAYCFFNAFGEIARSVEEGEIALRKIKSLLKKDGWMLVDMENPRKHFAHWTKILSGREGNVRAEEHFDWKRYEDVKGILWLDDEMRVYKHKQLQQRATIKISMKVWSADELVLLYKSMGFSDIQVIGDDYQLGRIPINSFRVLVLGRC